MAYRRPLVLDDNRIKELPPGDALMGGLVSYGRIAATSGSSLSWTGLPSGVKEWLLHFRRVSLSGNGNVRIRLSIGGSVITTGYNSASGVLFNAGITYVEPQTDGIHARITVAARTIQGHVSILRTGTSYSFAGMCSMEGDPGFVPVAGYLDVAQDLEAIHLVPTAGSFDLGAVELFGRH